MPYPRGLVRLVLLAAMLLFPVSPHALRAEQPRGQLTVAPAWELKDPDGKTVRLADFKGKVVILDFWATWCPPCRKEIPGFVELQKKYGDRGLAVVGVSLDEGGPAVVKPFIAQAKMNYPIVMGNAQVASTYGGIEGIPTTFIIDREGRIISAHVGFEEAGVFENEIKPLL